MYSFRFSIERMPLRKLLKFAKSEGIVLILRRITAGAGTGAVADAVFFLLFFRGSETEVVFVFLLFCVAAGPSAGVKAVAEAGTEVEAEAVFVLILFRGSAGPRNRASSGGKDTAVAESGSGSR